MNFVEYCTEIYDSLLQLKYNEVEPDFLFITRIGKSFSNNDFYIQYRKEVDELIDNRLRRFSDDLNLMRELKSITYYEKSIALFTCFLICWIYHNEVEFTSEELSKLSELLYIGTIGYRLFDVHYDQNILGKEAAILGNYMLHLFDQEALELFNDKNTLSILNYHLANYTEAEFLEKRNVWKSCPFKWDELELYVQKTAPLFSILELLFRKSNLSEVKITNLMKGFVHASIANQLMDDFVDAEEDLNSGIESLIMSGYFKKYGTDNKAALDKVENFLTEKKIQFFYNKVQSLFDQARILFTDNDDDILLLYTEILNMKFNLDMAELKS